MTPFEIILFTVLIISAGFIWYLESKLRRYTEGIKVIKQEMHVAKGVQDSIMSSSHDADRKVYFLIQAIQMHERYMNLAFHKFFDRRK